MSPLADRRILVAEDEGLIAMQLEELLQDLGCIVVGPVSRVAEVADCIERQEFDGALLDVNLRGETILPLLPTLSQLGLPFIITSGYDAHSLFPPRLRAVPRIVKPFDEAALRRLCIATFAK